MATRASIGIVLDDGRVMSCYHHYDGYLAGLGYNLAMNWSDDPYDPWDNGKGTIYENLVDAISLGAGSCWGENIDSNIYYGRDRGDTEGVGPNTYADVGEYMRHCFDSGAEYAYLAYYCEGKRRKKIRWEYMREGVDYEFKPLFIDALEAHKEYLTRIIEHHEEAAA